MAEQRQPFRFRLPWLPAPQPTPAAPPPTRAPPQPAPAQRPPFRPAGVAPAQPTTQAESQPPLQSRTTSQPPAQPQEPMPSQAPQTSPTRAAPQTQFTSPARRTSPQPQPARLRVSATPPPKPSEGAPKAQPEAKPQSPDKKPSTPEPKTHPSEEVFDRKEVMETFRNSGLHTVTNINGNEKVGRFPHKATMAGEKPTLHREMKEGSRRLLHKLGSGGDKHPVQEKPFSVITLTGENTGATMDVSSEPAKRERSIHIHRGYKINPDESVDTTTDGEGSSGGRNSGDSKLQEELATKLYVNNNAQGVNNSLVFNSSVTERNPGVHVVFSCNSEGPIKPGKERETVQTRKAKVASTTAEKLAYTPTIRRRCLRGLLLESSDSDPENPGMPQRHGCRVGCDKKSKYDNIDVL